MTSDLPDPEHLMRENHRVHNRKDRSPTRMEVMPASSNQENTIGTLANHAVSKKPPVEKKRPMHAESVVLVSQTMLTDVIAGIIGLMKDAVTALISPEGHNGSKSTENQLHAMLKGLCNKTIEKKLNFI